MLTYLELLSTNQKGSILRSFKSSSLHQVLVQQPIYIDLSVGINFQKFSQLENLKTLFSHRFHEKLQTKYEISLVGIIHLFMKGFVTGFPESLNV